MYSEVNFSAFCDAFSDTYKNNFTYEGKRALFDYLESFEEDTGEPIELDPIALCCEYSQFDDLADFQAQYGDKYESIDDISERTTVIPIENSDSFIVQDF